MSGQERWPELDAVLDEVLDAPPAERVARARDRCRHDPGLLAEVLRFLADADSTDRSHFLCRPAFELASALIDRDIRAADPEERLGRRLGAWQLTEVLGEGGMGVVYLARRADGQYEAEAAVKLMLAVDPRSPLRDRLLAERQILARLDDPRIARLYDGGLSDDGHPYLVMERVHGRDLLAHAAAAHLDLEARLDLFVEVCAAVEAAHRRLVLHCDLKPSNILVTDQGELKLLDFGVARTLSDQGAEADTGAARLLTPAYASPEQQAGELLTTASDVYALGVLLHELLTGRRPSTADEPTAEPPWRRELHGDLANILTRAIAPDPAQRYATVTELDADLTAWRQRRPVSATPATAAYRLRCFVRRHRLGTAAVALLVSTVLVGTVTTAWQARIAAQQRDQFRREAARARVVSDFLVNLFQSADPDVNVGEEITALEILAQGRQQVDTLVGQPQTQADLLTVLAQVHFSLGRYAEARDLYARKLAIEQSLPGERSAEISSTRSILAFTLLELGELEAAEMQIDSCLALRRDRPRDDPRWLAVPLSIKASIASARNRGREAIALFEESLALLDAEDPGLQRQLGRAYLNYGAALANVGRLAAADSAYALARTLYESVLPSHHSILGTLDSNWALVAHSRGHLERAEALHRSSLALRRQLKHDRVDIGISLLNLGKLLVDLGRADEALPILEEAVSIQREAFGDGHLYVAAAEINLGLANLAGGQVKAAASRFSTGESILRQVYGDDDPRVAIALVRRGQVARAGGALTLAAELIADAVAMHRRHLPSYRTQYGQALLELAEVEQVRGHRLAAGEHAAAAAEELAATVGPEHASTRRARELAAAAR